MILQYSFTIFVYDCESLPLVCNYKVNKGFAQGQRIRVNAEGGHSRYWVPMSLDMGHFFGVTNALRVQCTLRRLGPNKR